MWDAYYQLKGTVQPQVQPVETSFNRNSPEWIIQLSNTITYTFYGVLQGSLFWASLIAQLVKNPLAVQKTPVWFLGREDPLEKG